jgi:protein-S-isoprenylcysteine O-methyltransferase Ste14
LAVLGPACGWWLARTDPALLAERMRLTARDEQPAADKKFMLVFVATALVWFVAIGIDRRADASHVPLPLEALGLAMYLLSTGCIMWVFHENSFAAPVVKVQAERHHRVISTGPYAWVRHPMYSSVMLFFIGAIAGFVVGRGDGAAVRRAVRDSRRHRGTRADRRPAGLC